MTDFYIPEEKDYKIANPNINGLSPFLQNKTFDNFEYVPVMEDIKNKILNNWDRAEHIVLAGNVGIGKTHLAIASAKLWLQSKLTDWATNTDILHYNKNDFIMNKFKFYEDNTPLFVKEYDIYQDIMSSYKPDNPSADVIMWKYVRQKCLIIDDLFGSKQNEFARTTMFQIIDKRLEFYKHTTIITTNLFLKDISVIDERIASRLQGKFCFQITENIEDYRSK